MKKKKDTVQFRYYHLPGDAFVFAKLGPGWIREYGKGIDYLHFHNLLEIGYCLSGTGEMVFRDETRPYKAGDITMIPRKYPHTTNSTPGTMSHWEYLFINEDAFVEKIFAGQGRRARREQLLEAINSQALLFPRERYPELSRDILSLIQCMRAQEPFFQEEAEGLLAAVLAKAARLLVRDAALSAEERVGCASFIVMNAMECIAAHYGEALTVEEVARRCSVSETYLRRLFMTHLRVGVVEYINFIRVQEACRRLKETDLAIADISCQCGFPTISTFNRNFRKVTGESPRSWRRRPENFARELLNYPIHSEFGW